MVVVLETDGVVVVVDVVVGVIVVVVTGTYSDSFQWNIPQQHCIIQVTVYRYEKDKIICRVIDNMKKIICSFSPG